MMPRNRQWVSERERGRGLASSHSRWAAARAQWRPAPPERHPRPGGARRRPARCCARRSASPIGDNPALGASHGRRSCAPRPGPLAAAGTPTGPKDYAQDLAHWPAVRGHKALRLAPRRSVSNSLRASNIRSPPAALPPPFAALRSITAQGVGGDKKAPLQREAAPTARDDNFSRQGQKPAFSLSLGANRYFVPRRFAGFALAVTP